MDLIATAGIDRMWEDLPGRLSFCAEAGMGMGLLSRSATNGIRPRTGGAASMAAPGGFTPKIDIACHGDRMETFVRLPEPIGTLTYLLDRIPTSRMPPSFRHACEARFE